MAETSMCPAEKMLDAQEREFDLWTIVPNAPKGTTQYYVRRGEEVILWASHRETAEYELKDLRAIAGMRAALRALAEMEPTEEMKIAIRSELHGVLTSKMIRDVWNGMCIAAAAEGEKP